MFGFPGKFGREYERKKIEMKSRKKEKLKINNI